MEEDKKGKTLTNLYRHKTMKMTNILHYTAIEITHILEYPDRNLWNQILCTIVGRWFSSHYLRTLYAAISSAEEQWPCKGKADVQFPLVLSAITCAFLVSVFLSISLPIISVSIFGIYIFFLHLSWWTAPPPCVLVCDPVVCCHLCLRCVLVSVHFSTKYLFSVHVSVSVLM